MGFRDDLRTYLSEIPEVRFALLFGSRADGEGGPGRVRIDSDWDVAVYLDEGLDRRRRFALQCRMAADLEDLAARWWRTRRAQPEDREPAGTKAPPVDLVILNDASALLGHRALKGEWLLVRDDVARVRYMVRTLARVDDERYWLDLHWQGLRQRAEEGRFGRR